MMNKHTHGPWYAKQYDDRSWGVRQAIGLGFAICIIVEQDMEDRDNGEERANAELMAVAPDMYLAIRDLFDPDTPDDDAKEDMLTILKNLEATQ